MARSDVKVNVPVIARILLHLWEQDHQADQRTNHAKGWRCSAHGFDDIYQYHATPKGAFDRSGHNLADFIARVATAHHIDAELQVCNFLRRTISRRANGNSSLAFVIGIRPIGANINILTNRNHLL